MPRSRKRKRRHSSCGRGHTSYDAGGRRRELEEMWPWVETMFAVDDAERRGDARDAMRLMGGRLLGPDGKDFWRPWRINRLGQVLMLGPALPAWAVSRWIVAQAHENLGGPGDHRRRRSLELALDVRGGPDGLSVHGHEDALCKLIDHDWVYRQLFLYELGGLSEFIRSSATPDLLAGADHIHDWARAPMAALRLVGREPSTVIWERFDTGERLDTANIGSAALVIPGEEVLGRVVPIEGGVMLEGTPLVVPSDVAEQVSSDPASWVEAVKASSDRVDTGGFESGLAHDIPGVLWQYVVTRLGGPVTDGSGIGRHLARGALTLARRCDDETGSPEVDEVDTWACLGAALLNLGVVARLPEVAEPGEAELFARLSHRLAPPADVVCRDLAEELRSAA